MICYQGPIELWDMGCCLHDSSWMPSDHAPFLSPLMGMLFSPQLLTVNPEHRFSCLADVQASAYLSGVIWSDVCEKRVEPGFVPNVSRSDLRPSPEQGRLLPLEEPLRSAEAF